MIPCGSIRLAACSLAFAGLAVSAEAAVTAPDCAALESWAASIDKSDRWEPIQGQRNWLPRVFEKPAFAELFGAPALEWTVDDTKTMGAHIYDCAKTASKDKRYDAQKALNGARGYVSGALKGVLLRAKQVQAINQQKQQQAAQATATRRAQATSSAAKAKNALSTALDALLAQPDSPALLRTLARLRDVDFANPESYGTTYGQVEFREARQVLQALRNLGSDTSDPRVAPRLAERLGSLHDALIKQQLDAIAALDASSNSLRVLDRTPAKIHEEIGPSLTRDDVAAFQKALAEKRAAIQAAIVDRAHQLVDQSPDSQEGIERVMKIVANSKKSGVTAQQYRAFVPYAQNRVNAIADKMLVAAQARMADFPATLEGLAGLRAFPAETNKTVHGFGTKAGRTAFNRAYAARVTEIGKAALPAFKQQLAGLPADRSGLEQANKHLASVSDWPLVDDAVRADYVAVATARRDEIAAALAAASKARRDKAVAAGGDPDLVGYTFVDPQHASQLEFRDETRVMIAILGLKAAGTYEVDEDDVIVTGPHGQLVFTRHGDVLTGSGMTLKRQP